MIDKYSKVQGSDKINDFDKYYWGYQFRLAKEVLVPMMVENKWFKPGDMVSEIGCAEGGVLHAFIDAGAKGALGTDIAESRLETGKVITDIIDLPTEYIFHDIINEEPYPEWRQAYDLVLLRDVIEHLDDTEQALANIKKIIKPGGRLFVTFPPYNSPFGGHQQTLMNLWGKLPYIHLLPKAVFYKLIASGRKNDIGEVKRLHGIRMSPKKFMDAAVKTGYSIEKQDYYLLRPVFKMKFGIPSIKISFLSGLPLVKNYFSLEASYVLRVDK